jgi:hypothetical protein
VDGLKTRPTGRIWRSNLQLLRDLPICNGQSDLVFASPWTMLPREDLDIPTSMSQIPQTRFIIAVVDRGPIFHRYVNRG